MQEIGKTNVEIISDDQHWRITASTLTLNLDHRELAVLRRFTRFDTAKFRADGVENVVCTAEHAWCGCADLDKVLADRFPEELVKHLVSSAFFGHSSQTDMQTSSVSSVDKIKKQRTG